MRINRLWLKMALISSATAVVGVIIMALLTRSATQTEFDNYLQFIGRMNQMMGGNSGMMGAPETAYLNSVSNSLWIAAVIAVALAALAAFFFSRQITAPLTRLSEAASKVSEGDMSCRVTSSSNDEVGTLSSTFNCMVESLNKDQEIRRKLISDIGHEMGTPLAVIQSNLEGILDGVVDPSPANIASLQQETLTLSRLVKDLRTLSMVETGRLNLAMAPGDLSALVSSIVMASELDANAKHISLSVHNDADLPAAIMDRDRIAQVVTNLLGNALRYTSDGDKIEVKVTLEKNNSRNHRFLQVSIADTGQGISPEDLPHVFERYFRGTQSGEKRVDGSGIGLTVVKELVEAHKGRVWVDSVLGQGSTFYFTVPAKD